jgi:hypothetical protein
MEPEIRALIRETLNRNRDLSDMSVLERAAWIGEVSGQVAMLFDRIASNNFDPVRRDALRRLAQSVIVLAVDMDAARGEADALLDDLAKQAAAATAGAGPRRL